MKHILFILFLLIGLLGHTQCPDDLNHNNNSSCSDCNDMVYVYDINNTIIDSIKCNVNGGGFYNCKLDSNLLVSGGAYLSLSDGEDGSCIYNINGEPYVLPVELISFKPIYKNGVVVINWITATERNNTHFIIERSYDGYNWNKVDSVDGQGTSTKKISYELIDNNIESGIIYYRLKQYDYDGTETIEDIKSVIVEERRVVKVINLLGKEVGDYYQGIVIIYYDDGTYRKVFRK